MRNLAPKSPPAGHKLHIHSLRAGNGDATHIRYTSPERVPCNLLVDGGNNASDYRKYLKKTVEDLARRGEQVDLLVATHQDQDHIKGLQWLVRDLKGGGLCPQGTSLVRRYWFNGPRLVEALLGCGASPNKDLSYAEAAALERAVLYEVNAGQWDRTRTISEGTSIELHGARLTVLSPTNASIQRLDQVERDLAGHSVDHGRSLNALLQLEREQQASGIEVLDTSPSNGSSIAFLLEYLGSSILLLGDSTPEILDPSIERVVQSRGLERLQVDVTKLSHHGSIRSLSRRFLSLVSCSRYVFSTDGRRHGLPNKAAIARILCERTNAGPDPIEFHFNTQEVIEKLGFTAEEQQKHRFEIHGPQAPGGRTIEL